METVSGRIPLDSIGGDSFIHIPGDSGKEKSHIQTNNHAKHVQRTAIPILTHPEMDKYKNPLRGVQHMVHEGEYNNDMNSLTRSLTGMKAYKRKKCRFIKKSGHCNVSHANLSDKPQRFMADIFTTCVDLRWRWNLLLFTTAFIISWLFFGFIYWVISFAHGDLAELPEDRPEHPCVNNLDPDTSYTSAFLFSLETQTTIGYGFRVVSEECPMSIITVVVQSVFGCIIDAFMIGLIMAKISRPKKRAETLLFSKNAVVNIRDGVLCLMVRVGNLRKSHLVEATIRMQYLHSRRTLEGEYIPLEQIDLHLDLKNDSDRLFLVTPQTICHPIGAESPLYNFDKHSLCNADFEIIVILEGMVEATGMTTQARASYLPSEILWGHRFENVISLSPSNGYNVDFRKFDNTYETPDLPECSAEEIENTKSIIPDDTSRRSMVSTMLLREEFNGSDRRDSGVDDYQPSDSTKTLSSTSSSGSSNYSGRDYDAKRKVWKKKKQENRSQESQEDKVSVLTLPVEQTGRPNATHRRYRHSYDVTGEVRKSQNGRNSVSGVQNNKIEPGDLESCDVFPDPTSKKIAIAQPEETSEVTFISEVERPKSLEVSSEEKTLVKKVVQTPPPNPNPPSPPTPSCDEGLVSVNESLNENSSLLDNQTPEKRVPDVVTMQKQADEITVIPDKKL